MWITLSLCGVEPQTSQVSHQTLCTLVSQPTQGIEHPSPVTTFIKQ